ncbi:hypothetical protein LCGC14_1018560 [marine sediment metagenome]|uniref:Uncharacterized protein n=1 Tax=marine sediment metagenome TaxID=412755 RepID=A0A0F9N2N0_9ZZZZ
MTETADGIPPTEESVAVANALRALGMEEYWLGKLRATYRRRKSPRSKHPKYLHNQKKWAKRCIRNIRHYRKRQEEME